MFRKLRHSVYVRQTQHTTRNPLALFFSLVVLLGLLAACVAPAEQDINREQIKQAVLNQQEEILRYQLQVLEAEALKTQTPEATKEVNDARAVLLGIIKNRTASEKLLAESLQELWEAQGTAFTNTIPSGGIALSWPVAPLLGISAHFEDEGYKARFGLAHHAIDIPTPQGTLIGAAADGTVSKVSLNGLGYSYIVLDHESNTQTVYGHISAALVTEGDAVHAGDIIAKSGGMPGTVGAGSLTTGPHLHFAERIKGVLVDPLQALPAYEE
jgi:murein DD-endopeptidase MepM/ murein hydrolase activator NlpD